MKGNDNMPKIPNWLKLDNAATIYPSTLSKKYAAMFRLTVTLNEKVEVTTDTRENPKDHKRLL